MLFESLKQFPALIICGARQTGKSTLLKNCLKEYNYITLDEPFLKNLALNDPKLLLEKYKCPLIIDEIQYAPSLLPYIKILIDENRDKKWILF